MRHMYHEDGVPDEEVIEHMMSTGPPFIFSSGEPIVVGERFTLGEYVFSILRECTRAEFVARCQELAPDYEIPTSHNYFFEAMTD